MHRFSFCTSVRLINLLTSLLTLLDAIASYCCVNCVVCLLRLVPSHCSRSKVKPHVGISRPENWSVRCMFLLSSSTLGFEIANLVGNLVLLTCHMTWTASTKLLWCLSAGNMLMFIHHEIQCKRDRHKDRYIYRKQAQLKVHTPNTNLHVQQSGICRILIYADIDSWRTSVKCLYHSRDTNLYILY